MLETKLKDFEKYFSHIFSIKHHSNNKHDALWKYATCLKFIELKNIKAKRILDVGTADSYLFTYLMSLWRDSEFTGTELEHHQSRNINKVIVNNKLRKVKMKYLLGNFLDMNLEGKYDLIIDNCSIIHFKNSTEVSYNDGLYEAGIKIKNLLTNDGYFIINCDYNDENEKGEYFKRDNVIKTLIQSGLKYHEEYSQYIIEKDLNINFDHKQEYKHRVADHFCEYNIVFLVFTL